MMAGCLARVYDTVRDLPLLRPYLVLPSRNEKVPGEYARARVALPFAVVSDAHAHLRPWKLILVADHGYFRDLTKPGRQHTLYVGHHGSAKCARGENVPYSIGSRARDSRGQIRYTRIFEASDHVRERMLRIDPTLADVVTVVGRIEHDDLLAMAAKREEVRASLGFAADDTVVLVMGTWGEGSLFRRMGAPLIEQFEKLRDRYRFMLTIHAHEFRSTTNGKSPWGERLRSLRGRGVTVREPWDDPNPYLAACDVILTDHTSLAHLAALLQKPAVYVPIPESTLWEGSVTLRYYEMSSRLDDPADLERRLCDALENVPERKLADLAWEINSCPGEARQRIRSEIATLLGVNA
jgi:hypothetical protein